MSTNNSTAKVITILDYIGIFCLLGLFIEKDDPDVRFHTNQGLILLIFDVVVGVAATVLRILGHMWIIGWLFTLLASLLGVLVFVFMILGIVNAAQGQRRPLPIIGNLFTLIK